MRENMKPEKYYEVLWIDEEDEVQTEEFDTEKEAVSFARKKEKEGYEVEYTF
jgi:hypothetical protein